MKLAVIFLLFVAITWAANAPGTATRPILSASEAGHFTKAAYLQGWSPPGLSTGHADYTVGSGNYKTIQAAVNAAIKAGGSTRKYIKVPAGTYQQIVIIPNTSVPITIYGAGSSTIITENLSANTSGGSYKSIAGHLFAAGDPGYKIFQSCASRSTIGTNCASVVWAQAPNLQIINLTIHNTSKNAQSVALFTAADKVQVHNARLLSHQDTFWSGSGSSVQRSHVTNTYIEGDVDFVFGGGSTVFEGCTFHAVSDRNPNEGVVFAPETDPHHQYGFLVEQGTITGDANYSKSKRVFLARSWDAGVPSGGYKPGSSPNGQLVIRDSNIGGIINSKAPYTTSTSGRAYKGNASGSRNVNDNNYNRFWEYNNKGS